MPEPNTPPPTLPTTSYTLSSAMERIERLTALLADYEEANSLLQRQLTAALSADHTPLLHVGTGTWQRVLAAKSIRLMYLTQETLQGSSIIAQKGGWAAMADDTALTDWLPEEEALSQFDAMKAAWLAALEPPAK